MKIIQPFLFAFLMLVSNLYAQPKKIKIAAIGNSVTYGAGIDQPSINSYPAQLQRLLGNNYEVGNFGRNGATLLKKGHNPYYKTEEFKKAIDFNADIAIIHLGLNDTDPRNWPNYKDEFAGDYTWLIDTLKKHNSQLKIYICRLTPIFSDHPRFLSGTFDWYWQIQKEITKIAEANNVELIDFHHALYLRPDLFPVSSDLGHPTDVHPKQKEEIGFSLANLVLKYTYHHKNTIADGPLPLTAVQKENTIFIEFESAKKLQIRNNEILKGFQLKTNLGEFLSVPTEIKGNKIVLHIPNNKTFTEVVYGWKAFSEGNLVNEANLPTSSFKLKIQ